ncbi:MAG: Tyrosine recombinase XerC [Phycisphaerales bacterium]|nr:Tyrosine recombinase XerC [Phycisphaerales bacterium]
MATTLKKTGRPIKVYRTSWGEQIPGLTRLKDGRWRASGTAQTTWSESDERLAVARFRKLDRAKKESDLGKLRVHTSVDGIVADVVKRLRDSGSNLEAEVALSGGPDPVFAVRDLTLTEDQWAWLRNQIIERPKWVAERVGIEQIGYLSDLERPLPSAKLSTLIDTYTAKPALSSNELSRSKLFWKQFVRATGVTHVNEIEHAQVIAYEKAVLGAGLAPKSIHHRFGKVKTVFAFAIKRGIDIQACRKALDALAMLEVKEAHPMDPRPIAPDQFWKIYAKASDTGDTVFTTCLLTALNLCAYGGEISKLRWGELDLDAGTYVGRRPKTKISRVAVLWPEVIKGLQKIERREAVDYVFNTSRRSFTCNAVLKHWRRYRAAAQLNDDLTFGQIRDAAYSIACQNASLDQAKVLAGHAFGGASDFYIRRNPLFVAKACEAIRAAFGVSARCERRPAAA